MLKQLSLLFFMLLSSSFAQMEIPSGTPSSNEDVLNCIEKIIAYPYSLSMSEKAKITAQLKTKNPASFTDEELRLLINSILKNIISVPEEDRQTLMGFNEEITTALKAYHVSGFGWAIHPSIAFLYGKQAPIFNMVFKNSVGGVQGRQFEARFTTIGLKSEVTMQFDLIFALGKDFNAFSSLDSIKFGRGIQIGARIPYLLTTPHVLIKKGPITIFELPCTWPLWNVGITYLPFATMNGGLFILHLGLGLTGWTGVPKGTINNWLPGIFRWPWIAATLPNISVVMQGGSLKPII